MPQMSNMYWLILFFFFMFFYFSVVVNIFFFNFVKIGQMKNKMVSQFRLMMD